MIKGILVYFIYQVHGVGESELIREGLLEEADIILNLRVRMKDGKSWQMQA